MPFINGLLKKKGLGQLVQYCYLKFGLQVTVGMLDEVKKLGLPLCNPRRYLHRYRRHGCAGRKSWLGSRRRKASDRSAAAVSGRRDHAIGALQQDHRNLVEGYGSHFGQNCSRTMEEDDRTGRVPQSDLHHGRLRRARFETADPPAFGYARTDGEAVRRNYRTAHHRQLPRRVWTCCSTSSLRTAPARVWPIPL
jgi:hypothetical protein